MKNCPHCGNVVADNAAFCNSCGKPVSSAPADVFCPNCGEKVTGGGGFCPNCGTTLAAPQNKKSPVKKKAAGKPNRLFGLIGAAVAVVLLVVLIIAVVPSMFSSAGSSFVSTQTDFVADRLSGLETVIEQANTGISTDLTISASVDNDMIQEYLDDTSIVLKLDADQESLLANMEAIFMGSPVLSGAVTVDKTQIGFCLPELDDTYYVFDLAAIMELAEVDVELKDLESVELPMKDIEELANKYVKLLTEAITKDSLTVEKGKTVKLNELGGKIEKCTVYTFEPKAEDVEEALLKIAEELEKDKKLRKVFEDLIENETVAAFLEENVFYDDPQDVFDEALDTIVEELEDNAGDIAEAIEDIGFTWTMAMKGNDICLIEIAIEEADQVFAYECKSDKKKVEEIVYSAYYDEVEFFVSNEYKIDGKIYDGKVIFSDGWDEFKVDYEIDSSKNSPLGMPYGEYKIGLDGTTYLTIEVADGETGVDHIFTAKELSYDTDGMFDKIEVTINATEKGSAKKPSSTKEDISDYDEDELYELAMSFAEALQEELADDFSDLFFGSNDTTVEPYPDYSYSDVPAVETPGF